jgi:hypothetical protein
MEHIELEVIEPISRQGRTLPVGARFRDAANGSNVQRWLRTKKVREVRAFSDPRRFAAAVTVNVQMSERPGIHFRAWCLGHRATCTSDDVTAARRAVAKHVAAMAGDGPSLWPAPLREDRIVLRKKPSGHFDAIIPAVMAGQCFSCGCIEADCSGCIARTGKPCHWANADRTLCSACV